LGGEFLACAEPLDGAAPRNLQLDSLPVNLRSVIDHLPQSIKTKGPRANAARSLPGPVVVPERSNWTLMGEQLVRGTYAGTLSKRGGMNSYREMGLQQTELFCTGVYFFGSRADSWLT